MMEFSVVIPTWNRAQVLARTLEALKYQVTPEAISADSFYEVIVVDDGSTDNTKELVAELNADFPVPLSYLSQANRKQGAARNLGARNATGRWLLFLGDDMVADSRLLSEHFRTQLRGPEESVVIGYSPWHPDIHRTRFLDYIGEEGWQFGFSLIQDPDQVAFNFFYTSNLSISRKFFNSSGGFDEDFKEYGWEDVELSWRLEQMGMRLQFNQKAITYHRHPTTLTSFVKRQQKVGYSAWTFFKKHPELETFLNVPQAKPYPWRDRLWFRLLTIACQATEQRGWPRFESYYPDLMSYHYNVGILKARRLEEKDSYGRGS